MRSTRQPWSTAASRRLLIAGLSLLTVSQCAEAFEACVNNADDLRVALANASDGGLHNGDDNLIKVAAGTYLTGELEGSPFLYRSTAAHSLVLSGGWNADCSVDAPDPTLSILDGRQTSNVLYIHSPAGEVTVQYFTMQNGVYPGGANAAGLTINNVSDETAHASVLNNILTKNHGNATGTNLGLNPGGIMGGYGGLLLASNLIVGNIADTVGGAGWILPQHNTCILNNTIVDNQGGQDGGGLTVNDYLGAGGYVVNNIFWGNTGAGIQLKGNSVVLINNDYGAIGGTGAPAAGSVGNLMISPQFVDRTNGDYHLDASSPLRGQAVSRLPCGLPTSDLDGHSYPASGPADMGAYEDTMFLDSFEPTPAIIIIPPGG